MNEDGALEQVAGHVAEGLRFCGQVGIPEGMRTAQQSARAIGARAAASMSPGVAETARSAVEPTGTTRGAE